MLVAIERIEKTQEEIKDELISISNQMLSMERVFLALLLELNERKGRQIGALIGKENHSALHPHSNLAKSG